MFSDTYDLIGSSEAAELLGIGPTNFSHLRRKLQDRPDSHFPLPVVELKCGPIWRRADMAAFKRQWPHRNNSRVGRIQALVREAESLNDGDFELVLAVVRQLTKGE